MSRIIFNIPKGILHTIIKENLNSEKEKLEKRLKAAREKHLDGIYSDEEYLEVKEECKEGLDKVKVELDGLNAENAENADEVVEILGKLKTLKNQYVSADTPEIQGNILKTLISKGVLDTGDKLNASFNWKKPFDILVKLGETKDVIAKILRLY